MNVFEKVFRELNKAKVTDHSFVTVDILTKKKIILKLGQMDLPVVSIRDLIKMKKEAGRDQDLIDLKYLEQLSEL